MNYRGIVFDKDGTLLDFNRTWLPIYLHAANEFASGVATLAEQLLTRHGFDPERGRFESGSLLAAGNNHQIADAWALQLQQPDQVEAFARRLNDIFRDQGRIQATAGRGTGRNVGTVKALRLHTWRRDCRQLPGHYQHPASLRRAGTIRLSCRLRQWPWRQTGGWHGIGLLRANRDRLRTGSGGGRQPPRYRNGQECKRR